ncbi:MAG: hypothetical protein HWN66_00120 [Candidatus Helarchaeota archaeon]|nr:hypothetical protein [Candidatus Helarchaeota archaeon]
MEEGEEKKDFLASIVDGIRDAVDNVVEETKKIWDKVLGREAEGEEGEETKGGLQNIFDDIAGWHKKLWDTLLGRKGEEGEEGEESGGFDLGKIIRDIRNQVRDFLGMEPIPEEE